MGEPPILLSDPTSFAEPVKTVSASEAQTKVARMTPPTPSAQHREALPREDWQWLADQLRAWPTRRVHPERTMCEATLRPMAADVLEAALAALAPTPETERVEIPAEERWRCYGCGELWAGRDLNNEDRCPDCEEHGDLPPRPATSDPAAGIAGESGCICDSRCPVTEDRHWVNCPAHEYYANYLAFVRPPQPSHTTDEAEALALAADYEAKGDWSGAYSAMKIAHRAARAALGKEG